MQTRSAFSYCSTAILGCIYRLAMGSTSAWYLLALCTTSLGRIVDTYESHDQGIGIGKLRCGETIHAPDCRQTIGANPRPPRSRFRRVLFSLKSSTVIIRKTSILHSPVWKPSVPWVDTREWSQSYARVVVHGLVPWVWPSTLLLNLAMM